MSTRHHARNGSSGRKSLQHTTRMARPAVHSRRSASNVHSYAPVSPRSVTSTSPQSRTYELEVKRPGHAHDDIDEDDTMTSFLQFCTTCDRQILTPSITLLYCSEACRRRDSAKSIPHQIQYSPPTSPYTPAVHECPPSNIVPRRSPTILQPLTSTFSELSLYELNTKSSFVPHDDVDESTFGMPTQSVRPYIDRSSSADEVVRVPSLVHSLSSSHGTVASHLELSRPLPRKHSCPGHKGIDLVTPLTSEPSLQSAASTSEAHISCRRSSTRNDLQTSPGASERQ